MYLKDPASDEDSFSDTFAVGDGTECDWSLRQRLGVLENDVVSES